MSKIWTFMNTIIYRLLLQIHTATTTSTQQQPWSQQQQHQPQQHQPEEQQNQRISGGRGSARDTMNNNNFRSRAHYALIHIVFISPLLFVASWLPIHRMCTWHEKNALEYFSNKIPSLATPAFFSVQRILESFPNYYFVLI
jgi:hypothetical protein